MAKNRITLQDINRLCNDESYERGEQYLRSGSVTRVEYYAGILKAKVIGTYMYDVTVNLENRIRATCTCPYDWGGYRLCQAYTAVRCCPCNCKCKGSRIS